MFGRTLERSRFWTDGDAREHAHGQFGVGWQQPVGDEDLLQLDEVPRVPKVPAEMILVSRRKMFA